MCVLLDITFDIFFFAAITAALLSLICTEAVLTVPMNSALFVVEKSVREICREVAMT